MIFGYARVSTKDQNLEMQMDALEKYGCWRIFEEKITGTRKDRPQLEEMFNYLRPGDKVVVYKLDRISRSTKHLIELMEYFQQNEIDFVSIHENIDTSTAMGKFMFKIMASIAELDRDIISERTRTGLEAARARGRNGGRPKKDKKKLAMAYRMYDSKEYSIKEISDATGIGKTTLYRYLNERKEEAIN